MRGRWRSGIYANCRYREILVIQREKAQKDKEWEMKEQRKELGKKELVMMEKAQLMAERESEVGLREKALMMKVS